MIFSQDIFIRNISFTVREGELSDAFAEKLHAEPFLSLFPGVTINFVVTLFRDKRHQGARRHRGLGLLTLPSSEIGYSFLNLFAERGLVVGGRMVDIRRSNTLRHDLVAIARHTPFTPYSQISAREQEKKQFNKKISIQDIQFGRECRDSAFSVEWKRSCGSDDKIQFDPEKKEIQVIIYKPHEGDTSHRQDYDLSRGFGMYIIALMSELDPEALFEHVISFRYSDIQGIGLGHDLAVPSIFFILNTQASFYRRFTLTAMIEQAHPLVPVSHLDEVHQHVAPFTSNTLRVTLGSSNDLEVFRRLAERIHQRIRDFSPAIVERGLYNKDLMCDIERWLSTLPPHVGFQCDALMRGTGYLVDAVEMQGLKQPVSDIVQMCGSARTVSFLKHFANTLNQLWSNQEGNDAGHTVREVFNDLKRKFDFTVEPPDQGVNGLVASFHVTVTPTTVHLSGPFPEKSNRVIRMYPGKEHHFLRVCFLDENHLKFRFDKEVDGPALIRRRVGDILRNGIRVAGREFQWLGYSMSALREHAVWFVESFDFEGEWIDAPSIRGSLGNFSKVIEYPALYGARIAQAFTTTDRGVVVVKGEVRHLPNIERNGSDFTDGVGTISPDLAKDVWDRQFMRSKGRRKKTHIPAVMQIRLGGAKGVLSVDIRLNGRAVYLRPSMTKFESPSLEIEIAETFTKPGKMFLNRPLIMLLEGLGIDPRIFLQLQRNTVKNTLKAAEDIGTAATLMESYGLGSAFRLPSVLQGLEKLGLTFAPEGKVSAMQTPFWKGILNGTVHHALRELKHKARIPIPGSWTLVGVADVYEELREGEIFACILDTNDTEPKYLEGPCLITRSPVIHPGDLQLVRAIGPPRSGSHYAVEPLANAVVFSVLGSRSLPSCLGGGDLDGDKYNLIMLQDLHPCRCHSPAEYAPTKRKHLNRPSTVNDLADFVVEYINSDLTALSVVGLIATTWLLLADFTPDFVTDELCLKLADLHSAAVDYPKSGIPVPTREIPRQPWKKPDWHAPETIDTDDANEDYYHSERALGQLFRDITLPNMVQPRRPPKGDEIDLEALNDAMSSFSLSNSHPQDPISKALIHRLPELLHEDDSNYSKDLGWVRQLFVTYSQELHFICRHHTLSLKRGSRLSEEEVVVGTILAKTTQPRKRQELMGKMREYGTALVNQVRDEIAGEDVSTLVQIRRGWAAWKLSRSLADGDIFGADSFGMVVLGSMMTALENEGSEIE